MWSYENETCAEMAEALPYEVNYFYPCENFHKLASKTCGCVEVPETPSASANPMRSLEGSSFGLVVFAASIAMVSILWM